MEDYKLKRRLKRLNNREFIDDIKRYIKSPYEFYGEKVPELKTMAKHLHEEYSLKEFYRVFSRLWRSGYNGEQALAVKALKMYEKDFDLNTWKFLLPRLKEMNSYEESLADVLGKILYKYSKLKREVLKMSRSKNLFVRRLMMLLTINLIKKDDLGLTLVLAEKYVYDDEKSIQRATGWVLSEAGKKKPETVKRFLLKHKDMKDRVFELATIHMRELRKVRNIKKLKGDKKGFLFWR
jgi:3-methyladenine DNA glycosylase AlkD